LISATTNEVVFNEYPEMAPFVEQENAVDSKGKSNTVIAVVASATALLLGIMAILVYQHKTSTREKNGDYREEDKGEGSKTVTACETEVVSTMCPGSDDNTCAATTTRFVDDIFSEATQDDVEKNDVLPCSDETSRESDGGADEDMVDSLYEETQNYASLAMATEDVAFNASTSIQATTHVYARTDSEDEDVPMRVVDLIQFFTPQKPLEPPGDMRRGR
jgi:hypothetical protein